MPSRDPNVRQVGGSHYASAYQPWDFIADCRMDYFAGNAVKYLLRRKGDRREDLEKANHYMEKRAALEAEMPHQAVEAARFRLARLIDVHKPTPHVRTALENVVRGRWRAAGAAIRAEAALIGAPSPLSSGSKGARDGERTRSAGEIGEALRNLAKAIRDTGGGVKEIDEIVGSPDLLAEAMRELDRGGRAPQAKQTKGGPSP